jgi:hypothetical protein
MKLENQVKVANCYRFKKSAKAKPETAPIIVLKLEFPGMKAAIFKNLNLLGNSQFKKCSVSNEIPAAYRGVVWAKEEEAFRWRIIPANKGIKTKIE